MLGMLQFAGLLTEKIGFRLLPRAHRIMIENKATETITATSERVMSTASSSNSSSASGRDSADSTNARASGGGTTLPTARCAAPDPFGSSQCIGRPTSTADSAAVMHLTSDRSW